MPKPPALVLNTSLQKNPKRFSYGTAVFSLATPSRHKAINACAIELPREVNALASRGFLWIVRANLPFGCASVSMILASDL